MEYIKAVWYTKTFKGYAKNLCGGILAHTNGGVEEQEDKGCFIRKIANRKGELS